MMSPTAEKKCNSVYIIALGAVVTVLSLAGCSQKTDEFCKDGIPTCTGDSAPYRCFNFWGIEIASCEESLLAAHTWCAGKGGGSNAASEIDCYNYGGAGTETGDGDGDGDPSWDPREFVSNPTEGVYIIDYALVYQIKQDFTILENDSTILVESAMTDYFELSGVASGDLADLLGLQTGDIMLSVNGYSLDGLKDAVTAYSEIEDDSTLVLSFARSNSVYTHTYYLSYN